MTSGFSALRADCPMQLHSQYRGFAPSPAVRADLARLETLWNHARSLSGATGGGLFGAYCLADVFYTPVAARILGYDLPMSAAARAYCTALLCDPMVRKWRDMAHEVTYDPLPYALDLPTENWPIRG